MFHWANTHTHTYEWVIKLSTSNDPVTSPKLAQPPLSLVILPFIGMSIDDKRGKLGSRTLAHIKAAYNIKERQSNGCELGQEP